MNWTSQRKQRNISNEITDVNHQTVIQFMQRYGVTQLIHGHTHRPTLHYFKHNEQWLKRIVLSDWHKQGNALVVTPKEQRLIDV